MKIKTFNKGNILFGLSELLDAMDVNLSLHQIKTAYISIEIAIAMKMSFHEIDSIVKASLFHDVGAITINEKIMLKNSSNFENDLEIHAIKGEILFQGSSNFYDASKIIRYHHTRLHRIPKDIGSLAVTGAQIVYLADEIERMIDRGSHILVQKNRIVENIKRLTNNIVRQDIVDAFVEVSKHENFWLDIAWIRGPHHVFNGKEHHTDGITFDELDDISMIFCKLIDFKSRFTASHSSGVAMLSKMLGKYNNMTDEQIKLLGLAGNIHDLGKLAITNKLLEKPDKLADGEYEVMKEHVYHTFQTLRLIDGFDEVKSWASNHHEKLDGTGYPFGRNDSQLDDGSRIVAVSDIFEALREDRPYRPRMDLDSIYSIMKDMYTYNKIDKKFVEMIFDNYKDINSELENNDIKLMNQYNDWSNLKFNNQYQ